jgi:hypothetical protein
VENGDEEKKGKKKKKTVEWEVMVGSADGMQYIRHTHTNKKIGANRSGTNVRGLGWVGSTNVSLLSP